MPSFLFSDHAVEHQSEIKIKKNVEGKMIKVNPKQYEDV